MIVLARLWNMETSIIIILCKNSKGLSYMFFPCQHLSRTTCQLLLHHFSGNKGTENSHVDNLYFSNNMPQAFAFGCNPHKFLSFFYLHGSWQRKRPEWKTRILLLVQQTLCEGLFQDPQCIEKQSKFKLSYFTFPRAIPVFY